MSRDEYFDKMSYSFYRKGNNVNVTILQKDYCSKRSIESKYKNILS